MSIYLADISAAQAVNQYTFRYCTGTGSYNGGFFYEPRIEQPALSRREIFVDGQIGGQASASVGELTLVNIDGGLDDLINYDFAGRAIKLRYVDGSGDLWVQNFIINQVTFEWRRIRLQLRDNDFSLQQPIQKNTYLGNNVLPAGLEGDPSLANTKKPLIVGVVNNMTPVLVNSSRLIYQVNDGAIFSVKNVFDNGAALTKGADYASQAQLEATAPVAGQFRVWPAGGYFRVGTPATGLITATVWQASAPYYTSAADIAKDIVTNRAGIAAGNQVAADFTTLDGQNKTPVGLVCDADMTIAQVLDQLLSSVGAWWGFDDTGKFRLARFDLPSGTPVASWSESEIIDIEQAMPTLNGIASPAKSVQVNCDINWTVQNAASLAGSVPAARKDWLGRRSRGVASAMNSYYKMAQDVVYETLMAGPVGGVPEAARRLNLLKDPRRRLTITLPVDALTTLPQLGDVVKVTLNRYFLSAGVLFRVIGIETDFGANRISFILWGG